MWALQLSAAGTEQVHIGEFSGRDVYKRQALNRARISQTAINIEMIDMQKMIGDKIDPYQDQFQKEWRESTFKIVPEELPVGMNCVIGIEGIPYRLSLIHI